MMRRLLLLGSVLALHAVAHAATLDVAQYAAALTSARAALASQRYDDAAQIAREVRGAEIAWPGGTFDADSSLIDAITASRHSDRALLTRLDATLAELRAADGTPTTSPDLAMLQTVAREQSVPHLVAGGDVPTKVHAEIPFLERIATTIGDALRWIEEKLERFLDWLFDLLPRREGRFSGATSGMRGIVWVVVGVIVLVVALLAYSVARRSKRAAPAPATSAPLGSRRDEDPLSRGATEWERYAAQLAASGRFREAIRAWYHAVLVTCYSAGVLNFRKGRTNWEYLAMLGPSLPWRAEMIALTQRFEREWYGTDESSRDALDECTRRAKNLLSALRERGAA
jgi:hypothetical protein